jgi:hypothetical protein
MVDKGIGGHTRPNQGRTDRWITPREIVQALGPFDLDPCADESQPWPTANRMVKFPSDGLVEAWTGRVWLNPPYSSVWTWMARLSQHGQGTALIFARTETDGFVRYVWQRASAMLFLKKRLHFHLPSGERASSNSGGPSVLVAYGARDRQLLATCGLDGYFVDKWWTPLESGRG